MSFQIHKQLLSATILNIQGISKHDTLKANDYRVLFFLMGHLDSMRYKKVDKKSIARELDLEKKDVTKAMDNLVLANILVEGESEHIEKGFRFNI